MRKVEKFRLKSLNLCLLRRKFRLKFLRVDLDKVKDKAREIVREEIARDVREVNYPALRTGLVYGAARP